MRKPQRHKNMETAVYNLLGLLGENPDREGLLRTPERVTSALLEMTIGYQREPGQVLGTLFDAEGFDQMIVLAGIQFQSLCEHHILPFTGRADVGYIPGPRGKIVGISKLARLVDMYARRLQNQERITKQVAEALQVIKPQGVAVVLRAEHACMACRGVRKPGSVMATSAMEGAFRYNAAARAEFFELCRREQ